MGYRTIVVDPPWTYDEPWPITRIPVGTQHDGRRTPIPYKTMTLGQIMALPIKELSEKEGCHVYLWTTNRYLPRAFQVLDVWGVRYSQTLVWAKTPQGLPPGPTWAIATEYVLVGRIGALPWMRRFDSNWFNWPRTGQHSRKPEHFIDMIESVSPGPYVELFARRHRLGWDVWGNESANTAPLAACQTAGIGTRVSHKTLESTARAALISHKESKPEEE